MERMDAALKPHLLRILWLRYPGIEEVEELLSVIRDN